MIRVDASRPKPPASPKVVCVQVRFLKIKILAKNEQKIKIRTGVLKMVPNGPTPRCPIKLQTKI